MAADSGARDVHRLRLFQHVLHGQADDPPGRLPLGVDFLEWIPYLEYDWSWYERFTYNGYQIGGDGNPVVNVVIDPTSGYLGASNLRDVGTGGRARMAVAAP